MKICIHTLGCKVNSYESDKIAQYCTDNGHSVTSRMCVADMYIINSCAITGVAEHKSRQLVAKAHRYNSNADIIVVGCASQHNAMQFDNVTAVYGTADKHKVYEHIDTVGDRVDNTADRTRAFVKIQDGCDRFCSYCIVPYLRGRSRSRSIEDIVAEVTNSGALETVLIGIDISQYGCDIGTNLATLIDSLAHIDTRIRLGSIEPSAITPQLINSLQGVNWCRQMHLSLQSGSNSVLQRMNRHYSTSQYMQAVSLIRQHYADVAITTDIIVGFAGETEQEFEQTIQFVSDVQFANVHVFPYSPRQGTVAYNMPRVDGVVVADRVSRLTQLKDSLMHSYLDSHIGKQVVVLAERAPTGTGKGYTDNYIAVKWQGATMRGRLVTVMLTERQGNNMIGELVL